MTRSEKVGVPREISAGRFLSGKFLRSRGQFRLEGCFPADLSIVAHTEEVYFDASPWV